MVKDDEDEEEAKVGIELGFALIISRVSGLMCLRARFDLSPFNDVFGSTEAHIVFNDCFCNLMQFDKRVNVRQAFV